MIRENYRIQNGCYNCKNCFEKWDYDQYAEFYCNIGSDRPAPCGSVAMGEEFLISEWGKPEDPREKIWIEWRWAHMVEASAICDNWKKK